MSVGSQWYKFDFHNHTPASNDYLQPALSDREWLQSYMNANVDAVIISDHNTGSKIDGLKNELQNMAQEALAGELDGFRQLTLFPGVELTATGNVHILAIFHQDCTGADIERLIGQCNGNAAVPRGERNHQIVLQQGPAAIIGIIKQHPDALCILAHIDAPKGVLTSLTNQAELSAAFNAKPDGVEIRHGLETITDGTHIRLIQDLPKVRGSDAHSPAQAGTRTCWLKMSDLNFDGVKNALLDYENCILFDSEPPTEPALQLRKLTLKTRLCSNTNGQPVELVFSPFYNAIIGSRGTGKSTIVESIRLAMRKVEGLSSAQAENLARFKTIGKGMDDNSEIECIYRKDGNDFKLSWKVDNTSSLHIMDNGNWTGDDNWSPDRFSISIYSQKMLFELASDNDAFLKVCDESPFVNKWVWVERKEKLEREFKNERINQRSLQAQKLTASALTGKLKDTERAIALLSDSAYYPVRIRLACAEMELAKATAELSDGLTKLNEIDSLIPTKEPEREEQPNPHSENYTKFTSDLDAINTYFETELTKLITETRTKFENLATDDSLAQLRASVDTEKKQVELEAEGLRENGLDPEKLDAYIEHKEQIDNELKTYIDIDENIKKNDLRINQIISEMQEHRKQLTIMRKEFIDSLNLDGLDIKILPLNATTDSVISSYQVVTGILAFTDKIYDPESRSGLLKDFIEHTTFSPVDAVINKKYALLDQVKELHWDIINNKIEGVEIHGAFRNRISTLNAEAFDNLICWYPDDGIQIRYRAPSGHMENIHFASPGQKGASMLQFLLSYGTDPLLLDQPEDDLDCMMLSQSVIPAITANKQKRQLIIVSHSAPIVVNGDAEYVISMTHDNHGLRPNLCGALQQKDMKELICKQMEGGEKAFRSRYNRILN